MRVGPGVTFLSRLNDGRDVVSILLPCQTAAVVSLPKRTEPTKDGAVSPPYSTPFGRSVEEGGLAPVIQLNGTISTASGTTVRYHYTDNNCRRS